MRKNADIGLWIKIEGDPKFIIRAWRKDFSKISPKTNAKINGAGSNLIFLKKQPMDPKMSKA